MGVKGWGSRELPEGYEWDDHNGVAFLVGPNLVCAPESAENVLKVFAPDQIVRSCPIPGCGLEDNHDDIWPHMRKGEHRNDVRTIRELVTGGSEQFHLRSGLSRFALLEAPWFDGPDR